MCYTVFDGYYVEVAACTIIGAVWMTVWGRGVIKNLEKMHLDAFAVREPSTTVENDVPLMLKMNETGEK